MLIPALFTLFTFHCTPIDSSNYTVNLADENSIVGLISGNEEEVQHLVQWCMDINLVLNTTKTKEMIVDFRRSRKITHPPLHTNGEEVESVNDIRFLGVCITKNLAQSVNTSNLVKKAKQRLFFLWKLKQLTQLLVNFYRSITESILNASCTGEIQNDWFQTVQTAQQIVGSELLNLDILYASRLHTKASNIIKDSTNPEHRMFFPLPLRKMYRVSKSHTKVQFLLQSCSCHHPQYLNSPLWLLRTEGYFKPILKNTVL